VQDSKAVLVLKLFAKCEDWKSSAQVMGQPGRAGLMSILSCRQRMKIKTRHFKMALIPITVEFEVHLVVMAGEV
jgi:hypothetical protein